jgi:hypothetical protein
MRTYEIGGWFYNPEGYEGPELHILKQWRDYDNSPIFCCNEKGLEYWLYDVEERIESKQLFYIKPTTDYDEFMKQILICNLKYESIEE